jgi:hypothetical protein
MYVLLSLSSLRWFRISYNPNLTYITDRGQQHYVYEQSFFYSPWRNTVKAEPLQRDVICSVVVFPCTADSCSFDVLVTHLSAAPSITVALPFLLAVMYWFPIRKFNRDLHRTYQKHSLFLQRLDFSNGFLWVLTSSEQISIWLWHFLSDLIILYQC